MGLGIDPMGDTFCLVTFEVTYPQAGEAQGLMVARTTDGRSASMLVPRAHTFLWRWFWRHARRALLAELTALDHAYIPRVRRHRDE